MQLQNFDRVVVLCGNHEEMLLASADGNASAQRLWLETGGDATLRSFGLDPTEFMRRAPLNRGDALRQAVGRDMLAWLEALPLVYRSGGYFFCHAGVRPRVPLDEQRREDLLWIRREFLEDEGFHGAVIVHGHSETDEVEVRLNRINVDTAAHRSGKLTAVGLQGSLRWFISTAQQCLQRSDLDAALKRGKR
jgi:serine/threonine protein phosphatase 1